MMGWKIKNQDLKMNGIYANSHRSNSYLWAPSMHYAFLKKKGKKCSTLSYCFFRIFIKKLWNFAQSCLNSSRIWGLFFLEKNKKKNGGKNQKTCWGCLCKLKLVSKKSPRKKIFFLENALFAQTPPSSKKMGF